MIKRLTNCDNLMESGVTVTDLVKKIAGWNNIGSCKACYNLEMLSLYFLIIMVCLYSSPFSCLLNVERDVSTENKQTEIGSTAIWPHLVLIY